MLSETGYRLRRAITVCGFAGAACFFVIAGYVLAQMLITHGSREGNILRTGFGLLSFLVGLALLVAGILAWK
jgi:peptidoglycan/LPS O-acetylase OafA/YrhL